MEITNVAYIGSFPRESMCPQSGLPEFAFIGRSNVGKSSLINMLSGRKDIAKVSKQPGKTQMINYFEVDERWYLVDLPGYGYAKISKKTRESWSKMIHYYLRERLPLQAAFVLIDSRHPLQKVDQEFIAWCGENGIPFVLVFTKADKVRGANVEDNVEQIKEALLEDWEELPQTFITSAEKGYGRAEILAFIEEVVHNSQTKS